MIDRRSLGPRPGAKVRRRWCVILERTLLPGDGRGGTVCCEERSRRRRSIGLRIGISACGRRNGRWELRQRGSNAGRVISGDGGMLDVGSVDEFGCSG